MRKRVTVKSTRLSELASKLHRHKVVDIHGCSSLPRVIETSEAYL